MNMYLPSIWIITIIVGLPMLCETVYTPSLPDIARDLNVHDSLVEYTLTIYLFAFSLGTLFWGKFSDRVGRKPCLVAGLTILTLGCLMCHLSGSIESLMMSRFIQAFGGSVGSVLGQAICRDSFHGPTLGRVYSTVGSSLSLAPAIGPVMGGVIAEYCGWPFIFVFLGICSFITLGAVIINLHETHPPQQRSNVPIRSVLLRLIKDPYVMGIGLIIGGANGISFSYYAEGSFFLIQLLGLCPTTYGISFIPIALSAMVGGLISKKLHEKHTSSIIMNYGLLGTLLSTALFSIAALWHTYATPFPQPMMIIITILCHMGTSCSMCMVISNALAMALSHYRECIGTASSLFGFFYYCIISLFTFIMGFLHNGTLLPMPLYFFTIALFMYCIQRMMIPSAHINKD